MDNRQKFNTKATKQLGDHPSKLSGILERDILWNLVQKTDQQKCFRCNRKMSRKTFSIEHKIPWLDKPNARKLFFDLDNISFSHGSCNKKAARKMNHNKTHCPQGHPYSGKNLAIDILKSGKPARRCKTCRREAAKRHYHKYKS